VGWSVGTRCAVVLTDGWPARPVFLHSRKRSLRCSKLRGQEPVCQPRRTRSSRQGCCRRPAIFFLVTRDDERHDIISGSARHEDDHRYAGNGPSRAGSNIPSCAVGSWRGRTLGQEELRDRGLLGKNDHIRSGHQATISRVEYADQTRRDHALPRSSYPHSSPSSERGAGV